MEKRDRENEEITEATESPLPLDGNEENGMAQYTQESKEMLKQICNLIHAEEIEDELEREAACYYLFGALAMMHSLANQDVSLPAQTNWVMMAWLQALTTYMMTECLGYAPQESVDAFPMLVESIGQEKKDNRSAVIYLGGEAYCYLQDGKPEKVSQIFDSIMKHMREIAKEDQ